MSRGLGDVYKRQISIHALREEGDPTATPSTTASRYFYPRPPRGGRRLRPSGSSPSGLNFYPRPPRGGRRTLHFKGSSADGFLSTPSARRATRQNFGRDAGHLISIHALREEGDLSVFCFSIICGKDFYPRPPRGGRRRQEIQPIKQADFYPRPPRGGRLLSQGRFLAEESISIHALREEGDQSSFTRTGRCPQFLSTPSARRATREPNRKGVSTIFLSTPSARRATLPYRCLLTRRPYFYPRPPRGGRPGRRRPDG